MPMEVELTDIDTSTLDEAGSISPADLINGRGEEVVEVEEVVTEVADEAPAATSDSDPFAKLRELSNGGDSPIVFGSDEHFEAIGRGEENQTSTLDDDKEVQTSTLHFDTLDDAASHLAAKFRAEREHADEVAIAKQEHTQAALARASAEEAYKSAKADEKAKLATLSALIARGPNYPKPADQASINQGGDSSSESKIDAAVRNDKQSQPTTLDDPNADQTWRAIPIAPLLDGIKGMGEKKREAIVSLTPTLGDFEDLRGAASVQHKQLKDVMPKGVGAAMTDEIEERAMSAMRKHQLSLEALKTVVVAPAYPDGQTSLSDADEVEYEDVEDAENEIEPPWDICSDVSSEDSAS